MDIKVVSRRTTPLCFLPDDSLLCYHRGRVVFLREGRVAKSFSLPISKLEYILGWNKFASRLFRFGVRTASTIDESHIVLSLGSFLHELDVETGRLSNGWFCGAGIRPLFFTNVNGIEGFDEGLYFGGYLANMDKKPVSIYQRVREDTWKVVYTFPEGTINHVHTIVSDSYRQCLWVFTGDFDVASAIWKVTDGFRTVERVAYNDQKYRGCVVFAFHEGLIYATDSPFSENFIYLFDTETRKNRELFPIHGSCIYGCQWKDKYVFSSTVEGDGRNNTRWQFFFSRKRGAGIKDDYVHMYMGNPQDGFNEIYKEKKDVMPLYTFQFGVFKFPYGVNNIDTLYFQPVATKENDLNLMAFTF